MKKWLLGEQAGSKAIWTNSTCSTREAAKEEDAKWLTKVRF
jgi:hypothetical protein